MYFGCGACLKVENKDPEHFSNIAIPPSRSTMSESPEAPEELPENFETKVILNLLFIQTRRSSKGKVKESKSQKMKELVFIFLDNNYVEFLQMLLAKHSQDKYKVTER